MLLCKLTTNSSKLFGIYLFLRTRPIFRLQRLSSKAWYVLRLTIGRRMLLDLCFIISTYQLIICCNLNLGNILKKLIIIYNAATSINLWRKRPLIFLKFFVPKNKPILSSRVYHSIISTCWGAITILKINFWEHRIKNGCLLILDWIAYHKLRMWFFSSFYGILVFPVGECAFRTLLIL